MSAQTERAEAFAVALGAPEGTLDNSSFEHCALSFRGKLRMDRGAVLGVELRVHFGDPITGKPLLIRRERAFDRFGKMIGVNREIATGDAGVDDAYCIEADIPDSAVLSILNRPAVREIILRVVGHDGVAALTIEPSGDLALYVPAAHFESVSTIKRALDDMPALIEALGDQAPAQGAYRTSAPAERQADLRTLSARGYLVAVIPIADVFAMIACAVIPSAPSQEIEWSGLEIVLVPVVFALHAASLVLLFRGRSTGLRHLMVCLMLSAVPVVVASGLGLSTLNRVLDSGPRHSVAGVVACGWNEKSSSTFEEAELQGKRALLTRVQHCVPSATRPATFSVGDGALGARWIAAIEMNDEEKPQ